MCSIFPACVWSLIATLVHHMFLVFSCCCCFFRISCVDMRLLPRTTPFDASLLHLFCCQKPTKLIPFVLNRDCSHLRHISSVQPRSLLCKLICFLMAFFGKTAFSCISLYGATCFDVFHFHPYAFLMNSLELLPNQDPQVGVFCSWSNAPDFSSPQPVNNAFLVNVHHRSTDSSPEETHEGR